LWRVRSSGTAVELKFVVVIIALVFASGCRRPAGCHKRQNTHEHQTRSRGYDNFRSTADINDNCNAISSSCFIGSSDENYFRIIVNYCRKRICLPSLALRSLRSMAILITKTKTFIAIRLLKLKLELKYSQ